MLNSPNLNFFSVKSLLGKVLIFQELVVQLSLMDAALIDDITDYQEIIKLFTKVKEVLNEFNHLSKLKNVSSKKTNDLEKDISDCFNRLMEDHSKLVHILHAITPTKLISEWMDKLANAERITFEINAKNEQAKDLIKLLSQKIAGIDVSRFSTKFSESSDEYNKNAKWWLWISVILFIVTTGTIIFYSSLFPLGISDNTYELVKYFSTKILMLVLLISATLWCAKIYKVNRNLSIIYEHKSNSLDTFTEFVNSSQSSETKDFVLQETTKAIFSLPESGLISSDNLPVQSFSQVVDLAKSTVGKK